MSKKNIPACGYTVLPTGAALDLLQPQWAAEFGSYSDRPPKAAIYYYRLMARSDGLTNRSAGAEQRSG